MRLFNWFRRWRWRGVAFAFAGLAMVAVALLRPSKPVPFVVFRQPVQRPVPLRDRLERWLPARTGWAWAWRLEQAVFGKRKPVTIYAEVIEFAGPTRPGLWNLFDGPPNFGETNGVQVWLVRADRCKRLHEQLKQTPGTTVLCKPRISTADGIDSQLFQGNSIMLNGTSRPVGLTFACFPRVHRDATDFTAAFNYSEAVLNDAATLSGSSVSNVVSVQTNLDTAFLLRLPKGSGFFLFDSASHGEGTKRIGILVDPL